MAPDSTNKAMTVTDNIRKGKIFYDSISHYDRTISGTFCAVNAYCPEVG